MGLLFSKSLDADTDIDIVWTPTGVYVDIYNEQSSIDVDYQSLLNALKEYAERE